jgi:ATP-binding cassette subfamily F protein 3
MMPPQSRADRCLQQQASAKSGLEECEMAWLDAQEQLEQMLQEG